MVGDLDVYIGPKVLGDEWEFGAKIGHKHEKNRGNSQLLLSLQGFDYLSILLLDVMVHCHPIAHHRLFASPTRFVTGSLVHTQPKTQFRPVVPLLKTGDLNLIKGKKRKKSCPPGRLEGK